MTENNIKKWYVVRAVSGQENKVKAYIETEIARLGMSDYVSQVLVPTEKVVQVKDGKNGNGTGQRNPSKFMAVQFSLVAPSKGGSAHVVFDYPTMTIGGPLKY